MHVRPSLVAAALLSLAGCSKSSTTPSCTPQSNAAFCVDQGILCGGATGTDNCSKTRTVASCGICSSPDSCGGGGSPGYCGCTPESNAVFCTNNSAACGPVTAADNCGTSRTVASCGTCGAPQTCGAAGVAGQCGLAPIAGTVLDELGLPVAGAKVMIVGQATVRTTPANGTFSFPGVAPPYDIAAALGSVEAVEYVGVTRSDPILVLPMSGLAGTKTANISFTASPPPTTGVTWTPAWIPPGSSEYFSAFYSTSAGAATTPFQWADANSTVNGTAVAFERDGSGNFTRFGVLSGVPVTDTQFSNVSLPMSAVTTGTVMGTSSRANTSSGTYWSTTLVAEIGGVRLQIASIPSAEGSFSFSTPKGTGYNLRVVGTASDPSGGGSHACKSVLPDALGVVISVPLGPVQTGPATSATGVNTSTTFGWTTGGASVSRLQVDSPFYRVAVYTAANTAKIPDLTALGFTLPTGATSSWLVVSAIPALGIIGPTVDDTAAGPWSLDCNSARTETATRYFTTQ
jgi:hypothetical protein